ncbi:hypothetical protein JMA_41470 (plasmid) [Jeotgalibacillus malaysiensis]|uniref:Type II secretion system protein GspF domain-containing protein n=1 Tax=Jeotgalibacillus malaysiensis TaxID=1508404 RepID=A0A0B5AZU6_9BACL|nr:hypothetical protein [Jeotgalibacillus malaysiensis]AJD93464.1 hypothetical protein JMA_41470 [Jeotgalibacillus malaysiensis]
MITVLFVVIGAVLFFFFSRSFFGLLFSMDNYKNHQKRMRQLQFTEDGKRVNDDTKEAIDKITSPVIKHILPRFRMKDRETLEKELRMAGWDVYYTPEQFMAMNVITKLLGLIVGFMVYQIAPLFGVVAFVALFFGFNVFFKNTLKERRKKVFQAFPDFIRVIQGYLSAGIPLAKAIEEAFPYMSPEWKRIMKSFLVNTNMRSLHEAIERINDDVDIFEIQEFFSLVKLNLEQGIDVKESFSGQREKVMDMQYEVMLEKIGHRQLMATVIQGPLLLTMIVAFGLPTLNAMMNFGG